MKYTNVLTKVIITSSLISYGIFWKIFSTYRTTETALQQLSTAEAQAENQVQQQCAMDQWRECETPRFPSHFFLLSQFLLTQETNGWLGWMEQVVHYENYAVDTHHTWIVWTSFDSTEQEQHENNMETNTLTTTDVLPEGKDKEDSQLNAAGLPEDEVKEDSPLETTEENPLPVTNMPENSLLRTQRRRLSEESTSAAGPCGQTSLPSVPSPCLYQAFVEHRVQPTCALAIQSLSDIRYRARQVQHDANEFESGPWPLAQVFVLSLIVATLLELYMARKNQQKDDICVCCCCAARSDATNLKDACCDCCQGTGVCSVNCASCCGGCCCCCCDNDVCCDGGCCGMNGCCDGTGCCCCCSGKTNPDGKLLKGCCDGTGCCGNCCSGKTSPDGKLKGCCDGTGCCGSCCCCCCCSGKTTGSPDGKLKGCCDGTGSCCCCSGKTSPDGKLKRCCGNSCCCCSGKTSPDGKLKGCCDGTGCCGNSCCCCSGKTTGSPDGKLKGCCDGTGCCGNSCCCCSGKTTGSPDGKLKGFCDGCCCCSGNTSPDGKLKGCCDGTGCCGSCCCSELTANVAIYEGVPIQIV